MARLRTVCLILVGLFVLSLVTCHAKEKESSSKRKKVTGVRYEQTPKVSTSCPRSCRSSSNCIHFGTNRCLIFKQEGRSRCNNGRSCVRNVKTGACVGLRCTEQKRVLNPKKCKYGLAPLPYLDCFPYPHTHLKRNGY